MGFSVLIEVVRREHDQADSCLFRAADTFHRGFDTLSPDSASRNFDDRAKVASEGTSSCGIQTHHRNDVAPKVLRRKRIEHGRVEFSLPAVIRPIGLTQFTM